MKSNQWTLALAAAGLVSIPNLGSAQEVPSAMLTLLDKTTITGYVNTSAHWNPGTGNVGTPTYAYNTIQKQDGFNLNVVKLTLEKDLDDAQLSAGYKFDLLFGDDANYLGTSGVDPFGGGVGSFGRPGTSGIGIKQAYINLRTPVGNGLDFKVGVFDSVIGYESFDAPSNPNYTRSYGYSFEPTTHTGVLATYIFSEMVAASVGVANTFGPIINEKAWNQFTVEKAESYKTYMASVQFNVPENCGFLQGSSLYFGVVNGWDRNGVTPTTTGTGDRSGVQTSWYVGTTLRTPWEPLKVGASYDYAGMSDQVLDGNIRAGYRNAVAGYASVQVTEKLSVHGRGEYFTQTTALSRVGLPSKVFAATGTVQYDLWKNVLSRLEVRWDHQADGTGKAYGTPAGAGLSGNRRNAWLLAGNVVYKF